MNMANGNRSWERLESVIRWSNMTINAFGRHMGLVRSENLYQIKAGKNGIPRGKSGVAAFWRGRDVCHCGKRAYSIL